ncbi:MAG TPA: hypothetical protein VFB54_16625 [Burkholderiales bacterium]|nr:hypothetical protein [Burkholderiales bacterium]
MIGLLLAAVAVALIAEARGLLVGEGVRLETARSIRAMALAQPGVRATGPILSMYIGPNEVLLTLDLMFAPDTPSERIDAAVRSLEANIRERYPRITRIYLEPHLAEKSRAALARGETAH